jgi:hypothetical protein
MEFSNPFEYFKRKELNHIFLNNIVIDTSINEAIDNIFEFTKSYIEMLSKIFLIIIITWSCLIPIIFISEFIYDSYIVLQEKCVFIVP